MGGFFRAGLRYYQRGGGGLRTFQGGGGDFFCVGGGGVENFSLLKIFRGEGLRNFCGVEKFQGRLRFFLEGLRFFLEGLRFFQEG